MLISKQSLLVIPLLFLASCTNTEQNTQQIQSPDGTQNKSVVKVLNRVSCVESANYCSQSSINAIWQSCLEDGYVVPLPTKQVISSRSIKELTRYSTIVNINTPKTITDENGVIYESEGEVVTSQREKVVTGYCIGSEYIIDE